ncbi:MAG: hypothetical protein FWG89_01460 [Treponema sp.]|nr:hypothetical protein [Treponema sp.]
MDIQKYFNLRVLCKKPSWILFIDDISIMNNPAAQGMYLSGISISPPSFTDGYLVLVASYIKPQPQLRELRGYQSQTDIARRIGLSYFE